MPLVNEGIKMKLLYCVIYYIVLGVFSFLLGRILPKGWFNSRAFPYKPLDFEAGLYKKLRVKQWQNTLPDMSHTAEAHAAEEDDRRLRQPSAADASGDLRRGVHTCAAEHPRLRRGVHRRRSVGLDNFNSILPCGKPPVHHHTALQPAKAAAP